MEFATPNIYKKKNGGIMVNMVKNQLPNSLAVFHSISCFNTNLKIRDNRDICNGNVVHGNREELGSIHQTSGSSGTALVQSESLIGHGVCQQLVAVVILNLEVSSIISLDLVGEVIGIRINRSSNASTRIDARLLSRSQHGASQDYGTDKSLVELGVDRGTKEVYGHGLTWLFARSVLLDGRDMRTHYFYRVRLEYVQRNTGDLQSETEDITSVRLLE
jgi:hypothetical protein